MSTAAPPRAGGFASLRDAVTDELYRLQPVPRGRAALVGAAVFLVATVVALLRLPPSRWDTVWAEDGAVFLQQALAGGSAETVTEPYAGYLHGYPRLVAEVATLLPLEWAAFVYGIAAAAVIGAASWAVWTLGAAYLPSPWIRAGLAAGVVLVPAGAYETAANVANSHFFLMFAAFWALMVRRPGVGRQVVPTLLVALAALSDPLAVILLPLAVSRLIAVRAGRDRWVPAAYLVAMAVQLWVALGTERSTGESASLAEIAFGYLYRVVTTSVVGLRGALRLLSAGGDAAVVVLAGLVVLVAAAGVVLPGRRLAVAATAVASAAFFVIACLFALGQRYPAAGAGRADLIDGSRYTLVPALLLLSALALTAQSATERLPRRFVPAVAAAVALPLVVFVVLDFRSVNDVRGGTPAWSDQVEQAAAECAKAPGDAVELTIAPEGDWRVRIDCANLRGAA